MNLDEYLNQRQVTKLPVFTVKLKPSEYQYWFVFNFFKKKVYSIHIHAFATSTYRVDEEGGLWTMDNDGNLKSRSVFKVDLKDLI